MVRDAARERCSFSLRMLLLHPDAIATDASMLGLAESKIYLEEFANMARTILSVYVRFTLMEWPVGLDVMVWNFVTDRVCACTGTP